MYLPRLTWIVGPVTWPCVASLTAASATSSAARPGAGAPAARPPPRPGGSGGARGGNPGGLFGTSLEELRSARRLLDRLIVRLQGNRREAKKALEEFKRAIPDRLARPNERRLAPLGGPNHSTYRLNDVRAYGPTTWSGSQAANSKPDTTS